MSTPEIEWVVKPKPGRYVRVPYENAPRMIQKEYGTKRDIFRLADNCGYKFIFLGRYLFDVKPGSYSDLASGMHFLPRWMASRTQWNNWLDDGAHVHDQGHLGTARFPGIKDGRRQCRMFDRVMVALWQDQHAVEPDAGRVKRFFQRNKPKRKFRVVRAASVVLWRPDYSRLDPDWITITDLDSTLYADIDDVVKSMKNNEEDL
jgi:hypothetical protein